MIFRTQSGSTYEIDQENKRVRRLYGKLNHTPIQPEDGEWKTYAHISPIVIGKGALIVWGIDGIHAPSTETSNVIEIDPDLQKVAN